MNERASAEVIAAMLVFVVGFVIGVGVGRSNARDEAVKAGVLRYAADPATGEPGWVYGTTKGAP